MNKFFKTHQKKLLAIFSAFLMIVFFLPSSSKTTNIGGTRVVGTMGKIKVTGRDQAIAHEEWTQLENLQYTSDINNPGGQTPPLLQVILGPAWTEINKKPETFFLLEQEAKSQGIVINDEDVESLLTNNILPHPNDDETLDKIRPAVADCLMVHALMTRWRDMVKISSPMLDLAVAKRLQMLTAEVLSFPASDYINKVPAPTPEQIHNQYDTFSDRVPGLFGSAADVLGFGYKYPDRVKVDFIGLKQSEVRRAAIASKKTVDWYVAAASEFKKDREYFDSLDVSVPATQPATRSTTQVSTAAEQAATAPTTMMAVRKVDEFHADFDLHVDVVLKELYQQETQKLAGTILKKIDDTMTADYGIWTDAQSNHGGTTRPASSVGPPYDSSDYMKALAESIQKEFGVLPVVGNVDRFEDARELANVEEIGKAEMTYSRPPLPFAMYATKMVRDLMPAGQTSQVAMGRWQPSIPLRRDEDSYIFRVTAADASHTAPFDDVHERVISDWKLGQAYNLALTAARAALLTAQTEGLQNAANSIGRPQLLVTDAFNAEVVKSSGDDAKIQPLKLEAKSAVDLATAAEDLLTTVGDHGHRAVSIVELYGDATVALIDLDKAVPEFGEEFASSMRLVVRDETALDLSNRMISSLCAYDAVAARMKYVPTSGK